MHTESTKGFEDDKNGLSSRTQTYDILLVQSNARCYSLSAQLTRVWKLLYVHKECIRSFKDNKGNLPS